MSSLLEKYNSMSADEQTALGKMGGSKINNPGCHLVEITDFKVIDGARVKVDFKDASGKTLDYTGFLTNKDPEKVEAQVNRTMNQLAAICIAAGMNIKSVLSKSTIGTETFKSGATAPTEEYPTIKGKKLYITTYTEIAPDDKDANKCFANQAIDVFKFFDTKKRTGLEIANVIPEGLTMEAAEAETKKRFEIHYQHTANKACQAKLAELAGSAYAPKTAAAQTAVSDDEI